MNTLRAIKFIAIALGLAMWAGAPVARAIPAGTPEANEALCFDPFAPTSDAWKAEAAKGTAYESAKPRSVLIRELAAARSNAAPPSVAPTTAPSIEPQGANPADAKPITADSSSDLPHKDSPKGADLAHPIAPSLARITGQSRVLARNPQDDQPIDPDTQSDPAQVALVGNDGIFTALSGFGILPSPGTVSAATNLIHRMVPFRDSTAHAVNTTQNQTSKPAPNSVQASSSTPKGPTPAPSLAITSPTPAGPTPTPVASQNPAAKNPSASTPASLVTQSSAIKPNVSESPKPIQVSMASSNSGHAGSDQGSYSTGGSGSDHGSNSGSGTNSGQGSNSGYGSNQGQGSNSGNSNGSSGSNAGNGSNPGQGSGSGGSNSGSGSDSAHGSNPGQGSSSGNSNGGGSNGGQGSNPGQGSGGSNSGGGSDSGHGSNPGQGSGSGGSSGSNSGNGSDSGHGSNSGTGHGDDHGSGDDGNHDHDPDPHTHDNCDPHRTPHEPPTVCVSVSDAPTVIESPTAKQTATFTITLSKASTVSIIVSYTTQNGPGTPAAGGSATAGDDYVATSGSVTFAPGQTTKTVGVTVLPEKNECFTESFILKITSAEAAGFPTAAKICRSQGVAKIQPAVIKVSIADSPVVLQSTTKQTTATFVVTLSSPSTTKITIPYKTVNGTATSNEDYIAASGVVTFQPGVTTQTITVTVLPEKKTENETFYVQLGTPSGASGLTVVDNSGTAQIRGQNCEIFVRCDDAVCPRGKGSTCYAHVYLDAPCKEKFTVHVKTVDGTCRANVDYRPVDTICTFSPGQTEQVIPIQLIACNTAVPSRNLLVSLSNPTGNGWIESGPASMKVTHD